MITDRGARTRSGRHTAMVVFVVASTLLVMGCAGRLAATTPSVSTSDTAAATPRGSAPTTSPPRRGAVSIGRSIPASAEPPAASLAAEGGEPVTGQLGSFTWHGAGSDSPWLPGAPVHVGDGEPLTVVLADDIPVTEWTARRVQGDAAYYWEVDVR
jgi:hypothetical protein